MKSHEHRAIGDAASGAAEVNLGGDTAEDRFLLSFGDVVALSGDFFRPEDQLFRLARTAGEKGMRSDTRDEIVCALKVSTVDEAVVDPTFEPGGRFADFRFSPGANLTDVERRVRDRYLTLAAANDDHFAAPGRSDAATGSGFDSALSAYRHLHQVALDEAAVLAQRGADISKAMAREAAAQHYLTDAFAAGHLRTPVASIRRYWKQRHPGFWEHLQRKVAADTAEALREASLAMRMLPGGFVFRRTHSELSRRTSQYPELSVGDLVARAFHDWDNVHGLVVEGGGMVYGDGHLDEGVTRDLVLAAARAGIDDVEVAFGLGRSGHAPTGEPLYQRVRERSGARGAVFLAEERVPRLSPRNEPQNWRAPDAASLWQSPVVGASGPTVGEAIVAMLGPGEEFIRQVEGLGEGLAGSHGVLAVPVLGRWLAGRCCHAYHDGFVVPLARDPKAVLLALVGEGPEEVSDDAALPAALPAVQRTLSA